MGCKFVTDHCRQPQLLHPCFSFQNSGESSSLTLNLDMTKSDQICRILHPLVFGDYPETIKKVVGSRLPFFSNHESELVTNAFDFVGLNHYSSVYTSNNNNVVKAPLQDLTADIATLFRGSKFVQICFYCVFFFKKKSLWSLFILCIYVFFWLTPRMKHIIKRWSPIVLSLLKTTKLMVTSIDCKNGFAWFVSFYQETL